ncbi:MAG: hypothetical protein HKN79_04750 [Flavobacteriales bacterium]|nr:hypothetical protein [Flavobacteriales bacterium]
MKRSGVWIDSKKAWIYSLENESEEFMELESAVEDTNPGGGYGGAKAFNPQVASPENKILHRKKQQFKEFYTDISENIKDCEQVLIEGPAEAKLGLLQFIKDIHGMRDVKVELRNADSMSENQFKAGVRDYYS